MPRALRVLVLAAVLPLAAAEALARTPRTLTLRFPRISVPAGGDTEVCAFVRVPLKEAFDLQQLEIRHKGTRKDFLPRHFLVYLYAGEHLAELAGQAGRIFASRGCLGVGPADGDHRLLVAAGTGNPSRRALPHGLAQPLTPVAATPGGAPDGIGFILDAEWVNASQRTRTASTRVVLHRARAARVKRRLMPIFERTAETGLVVPPFSRLSTETTTAALNASRPAAAPLLDAWGAGILTVGSPAPSGDACVFVISTQMHKRERFFAADVADPNGVAESAPNGVANPFEPGRVHLFGTPDYTDPGTLAFVPPRLLRAGERLHYACWVDNGVGTAVRFGCEEAAATPPGSPGRPAKPCTTPGASAECPALDPSYADRVFTGACVPANAVAGPGADDEACVLTGFYFDSAAGASADTGCDIAQLP